MTNPGGPSDTTGFTTPTILVKLDRKVSMRICINEETRMSTGIVPSISRWKQLLGIRFLTAFHGADKTGERQSWTLNDSVPFGECLVLCR